MLREVQRRRERTGIVDLMLPPPKRNTSLYSVSLVGASDMSEEGLNSLFIACRMPNFTIDTALILQISNDSLKIVCSCLTISLIPFCSTIN